MKIFFNILILLVLTSYSMYSQTYLEIEENRLLLGGKPSVPNLKPVSTSLRDSIFKLMTQENVEFRYVNGSCEDRTHYFSLLLRKMNISSGKVWNFAPARITLISNELFKVRDPFGISDEVKWGYHVAPVLAAKNENGGIDTLVIDQSFSPKGFIKLDQWLKQMNCPRSSYLFTEIDSYLFNSINGLTVYNNNVNPPTSHKMPAFVPSIITGDFWPLNQDNDYVQKGLAINDLAYYIFSNSDDFSKEEKVYLLDTIKEIDELVKLTQSGQPRELSRETYQSLLQYFNRRVEHWSEKMLSLSN